MSARGRKEGGTVLFEMWEGEGREARGNEKCSAFKSAKTVIVCGGKKERRMCIVDGEEGNEEERRRGNIINQKEIMNSRRHGRNKVVCSLIQ